MKFIDAVWGNASELSSVQQILDDREIIPQTREDLHDPFLLEGMAEAVARIEQAVEKGERIVVYGDYDVDGITSCAIMMKYFESVGADASFFIPDRVNDGYGLSKSGLEEIKARGADLIITVDCGINAFDEAVFAGTLGMGLIITDHHMVEASLPQALAVINPKRGAYPFPHLAGCGVAFKLVQALSGEYFYDIVDDIIDIAAIGTVADIVSLTGENRIIVSEGLRNIRNLGLRILVETIGKNPDRLSTSDVGFIVAPVINAAGRIGDPIMGVELMLTDDEALAKKKSRELSALNAQRQEQCRQVTEESIKFVERNINLSTANVVVVCGDDWHSGVIGIVASRLAELYRRPAIILTRSNGQLKGSARSVSGVSIYNILSDVKEHLLRFGGHDLAAGLTIEEEKYDDFLKALQQASVRYIDVNRTRKKRCDYAVTPDLITMDFVSELDRIQPCGLDNQEPVFVMKKLHLANIKAVGADMRHAKITVRAGLGTFDGIAFGMVESFHGIRNGDDISILFSPEISTFGGTETISLKIKDVHSGNADFHRELKRRIDRTIADFIIRQPSFRFTRNLDFDIISKLNIADVYTYEDLKKLQKWTYDHEIDHEIVFGDEDVSEWTGGDPGERPLLIRFMPTPTRGGSVSGIAFLDYIPQRIDVETVFKSAKRYSMVRLDRLSQKLRMNTPKMIVTFELLHELGILNYKLVNDHAHLEWSRPDVYRKLEDTELFQKIQRETSIGGNIGLQD